MKLAIATITFSTSLFAACPNLTGHYMTCTNSQGQSGGISHLTISQQVQNNKTVYELDYMELDDQGNTQQVTDHYIADGKPYMEEMEMGLQGKITASCNGANLSIVEEIIYEGQTVANAKLNFSKSGTQLKVMMDITDGNGQNQKDTVFCE